MVPKSSKTVSNERPAADKNQCQPLKIAKLDTRNLGALAKIRDNITILPELMDCVSKRTRDIISSGNTPREMILQRDPNVEHGSEAGQTLIRKVLGDVMEEVAMVSRRDQTKMRRMKRASTRRRTIAMPKTRPISDRFEPDMAY